MGGQGLDRADAIAWVRRDDLFFAGDQRDGVGADPRHDPAIDLAGEQAERQADDPGRVGEHALDRQMRLAGIGRPQDGSDVAPARSGAWGSYPFMHIAGGLTSRSTLSSLPLVSCRYSDPLESLPQRVPVKVWNLSRTNDVRIADSPEIAFCSPPYMCRLDASATK